MVRTMKMKGEPRGDKPKASAVRRLLAWGVHLYTASGLLCAAGITALLVQGGDDAFRWSFVLMVVATLIDATDGTLARAVRIKETLPGFDGRRLDDIVDFLNYTCLPLLLIWRAQLVPAGWEFILLLPLLASAYGFCQVSAKTDDGYFLGFPSYWNLVALYLYALRPLPAWFPVVLLVALSVLTFVPARYLYPTQRGRLNLVTNVLGGVWALVLAWALYEMYETPGEPVDGNVVQRVALLSLFFPAYYMAASWLVTLRIWRKKRRLRPEPLGSLPS
jgi:phosphatidylcholine synthase